MNKFRNNLHLAFFDPENDLSAAKEAYYTSKEYKEKQNLQQFKGEEEEVKRDIVEKVDFSNVAGNVASEASSRYTDMEQLKKDRARFKERLKLKNSDGKGEEYVKVWEKKIKDGFDHLIKTLEGKGYFDKCKTNEEKAIKRAEVLVKYSKEVNSQYEEYIWRAGDKTFNGLKDKIFGPNSEKYPANKIYCEITGAPTIFSREKSKISTYDVEISNKKSNDKKDASGNEDIEELSATTRERIQFLAHDLPNYLWEVKDKTSLQKIASWVPFIRYNVNKPSLEDKKQIETFIKAADKLGGENPELRLLEAFDNLKTNATDEEIRSALNLDDDKNIRTIKKALRFYNSTQHENLSADNQHALYLSILRIVQRQGGFDKTISAFKEDVADYKNRQNTEGKAYKKGESLKEKNADLKSLADKLGITDYASATRLNEKTQEYFEKTAVVDILADLNNDGVLTFADNGLTKTGLQFKEIYNTLGGNVALKNLLDAAKLRNKTLNSPLKDGEITEEEIKKGNKGVILLLQNIISNPGVDLYDLMTYGSDSSEKFSEMSKLLEEANKQKDAAATKLLKDVDLSQIKIDGGEVADAEGLHQAVSGALYTEYARWIGLGGKIDFKNWLDGVSFNGGIQTSDKGASVGLSLGYNKEIPLGEGWTLTPGVSFGYVPMIRFGNGFDSSVNGSTGVELAKKWINNKAEQEKIGVRLSYTNVSGGINVYSAFVGYEKDHLAGIEKSRKEIESLFKDKIVSPLLDTIATEFKDKEFDLSKEENITIVKKLIEDQVGKLYEGDKNKLNNSNKAGDMIAMLDNTIRYLQNYNKSPIQNDGVRELIANEMSQSYSAAWAEQNKAKLIGKTKFTDAMVGASWVSAGSFGALVIHAGIGFTKYNKDMYGDGSAREHTVKVKEEFKDRKKWDKEMLDAFNQKMPEGSNFELTVIEGKAYIKIPVQALKDCDILINPEMKGLIKKDEEGNILLSDETVIAMPYLYKGAARTMTRVLIGGGNEMSATKLDSKLMSDNEWFATGDIDTSKLTGKEKVETQTKKNLDIMSEDARKIANIVYAESLKVTSNKLYSISHDIRNNQGVIAHHKWKEYTNFANAVKLQDYPRAKEIILGMLPRMDKYIGEGVKFSSIAEDLNNIKEEELGQALLSVNNIFARVTSVHGGRDGEYHFKRYRNGEMVDRSMGDVISGRAGEISRKVEASGLDGETKQAYKNLIQFAEKHREANPDRYAAVSQKGKVYEGAIGINLGNAISLENPLFNPEVYESPVIDSSELNFDGKDALREHIMKDVIVKNKSLLQPILSALSLKGDNISVKSYDKESGKITLDIDRKNVILGADMKFGYFAQCVNHMLLIDSITAEIPGETSISFKSGVIRDGKLYETTSQSLLGKNRGGVSVAATAYSYEESQGNATTTPTEIEEDIPDGTTTPTEGGENTTGGDDGGTPQTGGEGTTEEWELDKGW